jgi:ABC-type multidrug transport system permease subunit
MLLYREGQNLARDPRYLIIRFALSAFLSLLTCGIMYRQGQGGLDKLHDHIAVLTNLVIGTLFGVAQPLILTLPLERPIFLREFSCGFYDVWSYFLSKLITELPIAAFQVAFMTLIGYYMGGFQGNFAIIYEGAFLNAVCSASFAFAISALAKNARAAIELMPLVFIPQFLFSGFWIRIDKIPVYLRWIQYLVPLKYAVSILYIGEFQHLPYGQTAFDVNDVYPRLHGFYAAMLIALAAIARAVSILGLHLASKKTVF